MALNGRQLERLTDLAPAQQRKWHKVMQEFQAGELYTRAGDKVKRQDQALAIAFSEARRMAKHKKKHAKKKHPKKPHAKKKHHAKKKPHHKKKRHSPAPNPPATAQVKHKKPRKRKAKGSMIGPVLGVLGVALGVAATTAAVVSNPTTPTQG